MTEFLYREFCNHVYLGQWELARACAFTIFSSNDENAEKQLLSTLKNLAKNPYLARPAWSSLPCPSYANFLTCQLLLDITEEPGINLWRKKADFNILLEIFLRSPPNILQEFSSHYSRILSLEQVNSSHQNSVVLEISNEAIQSLTAAFVENPVAVSLLINKFCSNVETRGSTTYSELILVHHHYLLSLLKSTIFNKTNNKHKFSDMLSRIYFLLSAMPSCFEGEKSKNVVNEILTTSHQLCNNKVLELEKLYTSLLSHSSPILLKKFCDFEVEEIFGNSNSLTDDPEKECCIQSILLGNFHDVLNVMKDPLLHRLKNLVLILSWERCCDNISAMNVIKAVKTWDELLIVKRSFTETDPFEIQSKTRQILTQLQTHSVLKVIHSAFGIKNVSPEKVMEILKISQKDGANSSSVPQFTNEVIFSGYLILVLVLEAIHASCEFKRVIMSNKVNFSSISDVSEISLTMTKSNGDVNMPPKTEFLASYVNNHGPHEAYSLFVVSRLQKARNLIKKLFPLSFRVEILENIFSMLFLMLHHLSDSLDQCSDSDQGCEGESSHVSTIIESYSKNNKSYQIAEALTGRFYVSSATLKTDAESSTVNHVHSSKSTESNSSSGVQQSSFLCNEFITHDLLSLLKDLVLEAKAEVYKTIGKSGDKKDNITETTESQCHIESKVEHNGFLLIKNYELPERASKLLQYINEAIWRYEVVKSDIFQESSSSSSLQKRKTHLLPYQFSTSSSEGPEKENKKRKKKKKYKRGYASHKKESLAESSIIQCMLSSPEALLRYSLWSRNLVQAIQVIKLFRLQSSNEAKEVTLVQELERISQKLAESEKSKSKPTKKEPTKSEDNSILSNILAIEEAAISGLRSSEICLTVHQELSSLRISELMDVTGGHRHPELLLGSENIYSIFLADLSYACNVSVELSCTLLDMANKSWSKLNSTPSELDAKFSSRKKMPLVRGNFKTLTMVNTLLKEFLLLFDKDNFLTLYTSVFWPLNEKFKTSSETLACFIGSLNYQTFREEVNSWKNVFHLLKEFYVLITDEETKESKGICLKDIKRENQLHMSYKMLSKALRDLKDWSSEKIRPQSVKYNNYLSRLIIHLHQVTAAVIDCKKQSLSTGSTTYTSDFSILNVSPVELLKKIILQDGVTPEKVENFAVRMKVDLVRVLAQACLPHVPLLKENDSFDNLLGFSCQSNSQGYPLFVLNAHKTEWTSPRHPDTAAKELLKDLLAMIQDTTIANASDGIFTTEEFISLTKHSEMMNWMEKCSELAFVDLDLLQSREEKIAFYVNVTNIAFIFAILLQVSLNITNDLMLSESPLDRFIAQKILGFSIGQLGFISLCDLRYQFLHAQMPVPKHLAAPPYYQLFEDSKEVWEKYMPTFEPRLLFVLVDGYAYSPKLQVMYSKIIDDELEEAMKDYFDYNIKVDVKNEIVSLPKLLDWYALDFSKDEENCLDKAPYEGLINLFSTLVRPHLAEKFQSLFSEESALNLSENIDSSGRRQLPFSLNFEAELNTATIILNYNFPKKVGPKTDESFILIDSQPFTIAYLREKCPILTELYEAMIDGSSTPAIETKSLKTYNVNFKDPILNLMLYYKWMNVKDCNLYSWVSSALSPCPDRTFTIKQIESCFHLNDWHQALFYVDIFLQKCGTRNVAFKLIRQKILQHMASINPDESPVVPSSYALCIIDSLCRSRTVLQNVNRWPELSSIQALKYCLSDNKMSNYPEAYKSLENKLKEIILYKKIFDASEMHASSYAQDCVYVFNNWQEIADCSVWDQSRILEFFRLCQRYDFAVEWTKLHVINNQQKYLALSMNMMWYLNQSPVEEQEVYKILDSFENPDECMTLCDGILPEISSVEGKLCLVQYLIQCNFPSEKHYVYFNMYLGLKMLSALNSSHTESYQDLIAHPYLLLEEMLMNLELKDAEQALNAVRSDLDSLSDSDIPALNLASVNQLVEDYASKALEVHFLDALLDTSSSSTLVLSTEETLVSDETFIMPPNVPTKEEWVPDASIHRCQVCKAERFNMFTRRHHCRRCGRVVCANCSPQALIVEGYGNVKVRVCDDCYNLMTGSMTFNTASFERRYRLLSTMQSSSPRSSPFNVVDAHALRRRSSSITGNQLLFRWVLSSDSEQNASVRNEFSYEQAPSISLCSSLLKLHNDPKRCASFMLNLCDRLLGKIKPRRSGKIPLEIDYSLFISMIKSLLINAKVKCHQVHDSKGEALADIYFQHLDIMKLLVNANCRHLLPREALTIGDTVRKLRDKLLEEERMNLALEVSTKFNLDKTGVWSTWGLFCLRAGDWQTARLKFQQFLKKIGDKTAQAQENPLLNKILKVLENSKHDGNDKAAAIYKDLSSLKNIEKGLSEAKSEIVPLSVSAKKECLFYLNMYGSHLSTVQFYYRNDLKLEALNYILEKKCEADVFIEGLFMPMLKNAEFSVLKQLLTQADPSLTSWWNYTFSTCRHLERLEYFNVLYELQLFMEDYVRAAKSAINFYLMGAATYGTLFERLHYLHSAKRHYEKYLKLHENSDMNDVWKKKKNVKIISSKEAESYIEVIALQEEVTKFVQGVELSNQAGKEQTLKSKVLPTLLGNSLKKSKVVIMVILKALDLDERFELAVKIIKIFHLDALSVLCNTVKELILQDKKIQIPHFLTCVKCFFSEIVKVDEVILECVPSLSDQGKEVEDIIKMLNSDTNKINAYLMCGKLKSAYLLAIKMNSALDVRRIMVAAEQSGQDSIQRFCRKWLETNSQKLKPKESTFQ
ncbi:zinc finger FYVE domain-containing protein 26-like [Uloborus diversus]|uniref:zinc finger FYVE domain-containing protein 26-like n=1 Tax=Uloborus diversus TaxID=327109 RepID=UPI00240959BE|nr:zinc finger FYVE domain-containing protein 26-like [Uloborus diversus]